MFPVFIGLFLTFGNGAAILYAFNMHAIGLWCKSGTIAALLYAKPRIEAIGVRFFAESFELLRARLDESAKHHYSDAFAGFVDSPGSAGNYLLSMQPTQKADNTLLVIDLFEGQPFPKGFLVGIYIENINRRGI